MHRTAPSRAPHESASYSGSYCQVAGSDSDRFATDSPPSRDCDPRRAREDVSARMANEIYVLCDLINLVLG